MKLRRVLHAAGIAWSAFMVAACGGSNQPGAEAPTSEGAEEGSCGGKSEGSCGAKTDDPVGEDATEAACGGKGEGSCGAKDDGGEDDENDDKDGACGSGA